MNQILSNGKSLAREALGQKLQDFFDQVADDLFEQANGAASDKVQSAYLNAVVSFGNQRENLIPRFLEEMDMGLDRFFSGATPRRKEADRQSGWSKPDLGSLELLDNKELEENLAVAGVISNGENRFHTQLEMLNNLLASATGQGILANADNPLGPDALTNIFMDILSAWQADIEVKRTVYSLFGSYVIGQLGDFYQQNIDLLLATGVQPITKDR